MTYAKSVHLVTIEFAWEIGIINVLKVAYSTCPLVRRRHKRDTASYAES